MWGCTKGCWSRSPVVPHRCGFGPPAVARGGPQRRRGSGLGVMEELRPPPPQPPTPHLSLHKAVPRDRGGGGAGQPAGTKTGAAPESPPRVVVWGGADTACRRRDGGGGNAGARNRWRSRPCGQREGRELPRGVRPPPSSREKGGGIPGDHRSPGGPRPEDPSLPPSLLPPLRPGAGGARPIRRGPPVGPGPWGGRNARPRGRGSPRSSCCSAAASSPGRWQPPPTIASSEKRRGPAAGPGGAAATAAAIFGAPRSRAAPRPRPLSVSAAGPRPLMSPAANGRARRGERGRRGRGGKGRLKGAMAGWGRRVGPGARGPWYVPCGAGRRGCNAARGAAWGTAGERNAVCRSAGYGY